MVRRMSLWWLGLSVVLPVAVLPAADQSQAPAVVDKTLVAWVQVADLDQQGGSVLTLIDRGERFDAIVFGERQTRRWMAGSDFFRRTWRDQADWPAETVGPETLVQLAIVYRGRQVSLYRDGKLYAAYEIAQPQAFGDDAMVLIGLRYVGAMGEIGFYRGAVDDARVYAAALAPDEIAALKPNQPSAVQPWAWWDFADGRVADRQGRFPACRLMGGARIVDGRLQLTGDGYLGAAKDEKSLALEPEEDSFDQTVQTMFYQPRSRRTGEMWDTWLFLDQGTWYLFYLAKGGAQWNNVSLATSPDGVRWTEHGRILSMNRGVTWMGTGSTWKSPHFAQDRKYVLNFSEWRGPRQTIFFAQSQDLRQWTRLGGEYEFVQDERWYERAGRWDCIWTIPKPDGSGLYGYWTATPKPDTGGRFGFGESADGSRWQALPPPQVLGVGEGEVGAIEKVGGRYYLMFGHFPTMQTLVAPRPEGPFQLAEKNPVLLDKHTYFSRFLATPDGLLVNHHSIARHGRVFFAPLKAAAIDDAGTLRLAWWKGNEALKQREIEIQAPGAPGAVALLGNTFDVAEGLILEGTLALPAAGQSPRGLYLPSAGGAATGILIDDQGRAQIGPIQPDGTGSVAEEKVDRQWSFGHPARFRLLLKQALVEFYLDDILIECYSLPQDSSGRISLLGDRQAFGSLRAWSAHAAADTR